MQNEEWYINEISKLNKQIQFLHQQIAQFKQYIGDKDVYEYHVKSLKVDKVKGTFQIGHLIEKDLQDEKAIHRFFIDEIKITQVEGKGTLGIGITEKGKGKKKKQKKVTPEEANEKVKKLYDKIKNLLAVKKVPEFFQKLAVKEDVLQEVYEQMEKQWNSSQAFNQFYNEIKSSLQQFKLPMIDEQKKSNQDIDRKLCDEFSKQIEEDSKVLLVIIYLLHGYLPGYVKNLSFQEVSKDQLKLHVGIEDGKQILNALKKGFHVKEIPYVIKKLKDEPQILQNAFFLMIKPAVEEGVVEEYLHSLKELFNSKTDEFPTFSLPKKWGEEKKSFLLSHLIEGLESHSKYTILLYLFQVYLCPPSVGGDGSHQHSRPLV